MKIKYVVAVLFALTLLFFPTEPAPAAEEGANEASGPGLETTAESGILMDNATGNILWSKEPDKELPMASVTKIMTSLLANEALERGKIKLDERVTVTESAWKMGGSQIYLEPGEEMSMKEMLIAVAVGSANDASVAVAEHIAGSEEAFVALMNKRVKEMGLDHTKFANCTGLPADNHYTSAHDMAVIFREALKHPVFREYSSIYRYDLRGGDFVLWNRNKLLKWYRGVDAGKTGWTNEAKYCMAATAERDGLRLISVVLGTPEPRSHFRETIRIFNYGFARYEVVNFAQKGDKLATVQISKGIRDQVGVVPASDIALAVPKGESKHYNGQADLPENVGAPVKKGQKIGYFIVLKDKQKTTKIPLVAQNDVPRASILQQMYKVLDHALTK